MTALTEAERIAAGLTEAQRRCLLGIHSGFEAGEVFRLGEGEHHAPYTALVKAGALGKARPGDWYTMYWFTPLGLEVRKVLEASS